MMHVMIICIIYIASFVLGKMINDVSYDNSYHSCGFVVLEKMMRFCLYWRR